MCYKNYISYAAATGSAMPGESSLGAAYERSLRDGAAMWFKVAPQVLDPMFSAVGMYYGGARVLVRVIMRENGGRFAEVQDDRGNIVRTFINGLPSLLEFDLSSSASHFRLELADRSIVQPLPPTAIDESDLAAWVS